MSEETKGPPGASEAELLAPGLIHEMKQPLMGIMAGLQLLSRRLPKGTTELDEWRMVTEQLGRLDELFRTFQDFLHPEKVPAGPFGVEAVMRRASELLRFRLRKLGARFEVKVEGPTPVAIGSSSALMHAVVNLISNALDALEEAGGTGRLQVMTRTVAGRVEVRVADEGTGVAPEVRSRIFDVGITTKPPGKGSGLGLAIARRLLGTSGGTVELVSPQDPAYPSWARTEFCISLQAAPAVTSFSRMTPVPRAFSLIPQTPRPQPLPSTGAQPLAKAQVRPSPSVRRALVVEDEEVIRELLATALGAEGFEVRLASTTTDGLAEVKAGAFDLLVTDKNLPGEGGLAVARAMRAACPDASIVVVTGYPSRQSADDFLALGIDGFLLKPFDLDELTSKVQLFVERRRTLKGTPRPKRVLVVEADPALRARLEAMLRKRGAEPVIAEDLVAGLSSGVDGAILRQEGIGPAALAALAALQAGNPGFRLVLITALQSLQAPLAAIGVGALALLTPPCDDARLDEAALALGLGA